MKTSDVKLHKENVDKFIHDVPFVKVYKDGTIDYCLGMNYEEAGKVVRTILALKDKTTI